jgi:DNA-binding GntR family transcriptional regulator
LYKIDKSTGPTDFIDAMNAPLKHRTLSAAIADRLREEILGGVHASGAQLRQDALASAYGVSRIPVREALFALEAEGLVRMEPHRGAVVTGLTLDEVRDVYDLRALLEPRLLEQSIPRLDAADFAALDRVQTRFAEAIRQLDRAAWGLLNAELHMTMYGKAPAPRSLAIVGSLLQTSERYTRLQLASEAAWLRATSEHAELIALSRARKVGKARALLVRHIETVRDDIEALMRRPSGKGD